MSFSVTRPATAGSPSLSRHCAFPTDTPAAIMRPRPGPDSIGAPVTGTLQTETEGGTGTMFTMEEIRLRVGGSEAFQRILGLQAEIVKRGEKAVAAIVSSPFDQVRFQVMVSETLA